ncbi:MAG TPA: ATP-binding protein [Gaiellaceae bacterium]|jgi:signal transduction histidine kinase
MRIGLTARILIAGGIVVLFLAVQFGLVAHSFRSVRHFTNSEQRAERTVVAGTQVEKFVLDLETGSRGYVVTNDPSFLEPWRRAQRELPAESRLLMTLSPGAWADQLDRAWRSYLERWSKPLVRLAAQNPQAARARIATQAGKRRVDAIRRLVDPELRRMDQLAARDRGRVSGAERNGVAAGVAGIIVTILFFVAVVGYFLRAAIAPVRRIAAATREVATGALGVEVPEGGAGEIGQLATAFNEMSRSLSGHQRELAEQNVDLERLANVLRAVLNSTVDGILLSDSEGNVQLANRPMITLTRDLGMSFEGPVVDRLLSVEQRMADPGKYRQAMERLRANPDAPTFDEFEDTVSGRVFQGFTAPVHDDHGGFLGRIWTLRDVTKERELDRLKDDFVATVSHELRTPLTSMMGFLEMIREGEAGELTDEQKRFLAIVYRSSERLQRLVGDLLFVARLDANGLQLQFGPVDLDEVVRDAVESSGALARSRDLDLQSELAPVPLITGDKERLAQLVGNLVSNALKFTAAGGRVIVRAFVDGGHAVVEVEDNGIGIPAGEQDRLFQRFFRSSIATEQAIPGTGLGLVISRAIAEAHGGTIDVRSEAGAGACFRVELPLDPEEVAA